MLRLNASVHSWLTRHEKRKQLESSTSTPTMNNKTGAETRTKQNADTGNRDEQNHSTDESALESSTITLKATTTSNGVGTSIDINDCTFNEDLHKQLKNEVGNMYSVWDQADERYKKKLFLLLSILKSKFYYCDFLKWHLFDVFVSMGFDCTVFVLCIYIVNINMHI